MSLIIPSIENTRQPVATSSITSLRVGPPASRTLGKEKDAKMEMESLEALGWRRMRAAGASEGAGLQSSGRGSQEVKNSAAKGGQHGVPHSCLTRKTHVINKD